MKQNFGVSCDRKEPGAITEEGERVTKGNRGVDVFRPHYAPSRGPGRVIGWVRMWEGLDLTYVPNL